MPFTITVLGSGTSVGVPMIGCDCRVCTSADPRDQRTRCSIWIEFDGHSVLIDTTPDFRSQALRARMRRLDAVLLTHAHADHIMGLDDVRPFNFKQPGEIPIYADEPTRLAIERIFPYVFDATPTPTTKPRLTAKTFDGNGFSVGGREFQPIRLDHGGGVTWGFRFGRAAYLTDHNQIPEESLEQLAGLDVLFLDALRHKPHPTHSHLSQSLKYVEQLRPARAFFTHICHDLQHEGTESLLPPHVRLAYDGLRIEVAP
jgi:phosphoribosyl 1,2-cyclic phosphate phosphodiesterase